jgi:hypothetical protein
MLVFIATLVVVACRCGAGRSARFPLMLAAAAIIDLVVNHHSALRAARGPK